MKRYPISQILDRASERGIVLWIANSEIQAEGPAGTLTDLFYRVIAEHKSELLAVLPAPLCAACLDENKEARATWEGSDGLLYCESHRPVQRLLLS